MITVGTIITIPLMKSRIKRGVPNSSFKQLTNHLTELMQMRQVQLESECPAFQVSTAKIHQFKTMLQLNFSVY
jgi:hypothetical protein